MAGKGGEEDRNCDGDCTKRDIERVGEEWRELVRSRRNWRLLIDMLISVVNSKGILSCPQYNEKRMI